MVRDVVLGLHITCGALALVLGPLAVIARNAGGRLAGAYYWTVAGVCVSAGFLVVLAPSRLWWLAPIAAGSYALALVGRRASGRYGVRWMRLRVHGQAGSYVALVTALLVVSVGSPLAWIAPSLVGAPLIALVLRRRLARRAAMPLLSSPSLPDA